MICYCCVHLDGRDCEETVQVEYEYIPERKTLEALPNGFGFTDVIDPEQFNILSMRQVFTGADGGKVISDKEYEPYFIPEKEIINQIKTIHHDKE